MTELSILICSLESRAVKLDRLLRSLYVQVIMLDHVGRVEILFEVDSKQISTGEKRNKLLDRASGKYICFIDDDDHVYESYIGRILEAIKLDTDCIATQGHYSINGGHKILWKLSKDYADHDGNENGSVVLYRRANHLTPVKRECAIKARFPHISNAEDKAYSERLNKYIKTETSIPEPIYHYDYETANKQY